MADPTPSPTMPVIMTAIGGGSGLTAFAAKAIMVALEAGAETAPFLNTLQADSTAMKLALPGFASGNWTTTTGAGGSITSKISEGVASAAVSVQPLSPQVRQQFNPGDTLSTYMLTLQMTGVALWGGTTYFIAFNNVTPQVQTELLQALQSSFVQVVKTVASRMWAAATNPDGSPTRNGELVGLQQELQQILSQPLSAGGQTYPISIMVAGGFVGALGCALRNGCGIQLPAAGAANWTAVATEEEGEAVAATTCDLTTLCSGMLLAIGGLIVIFGVVVALYDFIENTYYHTLVTLNLTFSTDFMPSVPAADNASTAPVSGSLQGQSIPRLCLVPSNPQVSAPPLPCVGLNVFTMSNENQTTTLEGFNYLARFQAINSDAPAQNVVAIINIPRFGNNSMLTAVNPTSTNYSGLLSQCETAFQLQQFASTANGVTANLTMNALQGQSNDQYSSLLVISDAAGMAALKNWAATAMI